MSSYYTNRYLINILTYNNTNRLPNITKYILFVNNINKHTTYANGTVQTN